MSNNVSGSSAEPRSPGLTSPSVPMSVSGGHPPLTDQALLVVNPRGTIEYCSRQARGLLDPGDEDIEGQELARLMPTLPLQAATPGYNCAYLTFHHPAGRWHMLTVVSRTDEMICLEVSFLVVAMGNITRILVGLRAPALSRDSGTDSHFQRFLDSLNGSADAVVVTDTAGVVEYVNPTYERISGWHRHELIGRTRRPAVMEVAETPASMKDDEAPRPLRKERTRSGQPLYLDEQIRPFTDRSGGVKHYVCVARDVSHHVRAEQALLQRANFDCLTGIANRHLLTQRLQQESARAEREHSGFAVICTDMDQLKFVNDHRGHAAGDAALRAVATRLRHCVREMDTVGRLGGDEFLLIIPGLHKAEDVDALLAKLVAAVRDIWADDPSPLRVTLSAGAAIYPRDGRDANELLQAADAAMYAAKRLGGNRHCPCTTPAGAIPAAATPAARFLRAVPALPGKRIGALQQPTMG